MRLSRLKLINFRQHADTEIYFDLGITGIIGPNGAGKSTILEAIAWALYGGNTARGGTDSIRFHRAQPRSSVRVELDIELAGHKYRAVRGISTAELYLDDGAEPIANSVSAVTETLQRRIGMTRAEFFNTYFTGQKELAVMQSLTATDRGKFLSRVLGYEKLRVAQEYATARKKEIGSEIAGVREGMRDKESVERQERESAEELSRALKELSEYEKSESESRVRLQDIAPRWVAAQTLRDERQKIETQLVALDGQIATVLTVAERLARDIAEVNEARSKLDAMRDDLEKLESVDRELEAQRKLQAGDARRRALLEARQALVEEIDSLAESQKRMEGAPQLQTEVTAELEERRRAHAEAEEGFQARNNDWIRDRQEVSTRLEALRAQFREYRDQRNKLLSLGEEGECPTCTRKLGEHFRGVLDVVEQQVETAEADGRYFKSRLDQLETMPADVAHLDETRRKLQAEVGTLELRLERVRNDVAQLATTARDLNAKRSRLENVEKELAGIETGYDEARHRDLEESAKRLNVLKQTAAGYSNRIEKESALLAEIEQQNVRRSELESERAVIQERLGSIGVPSDDYEELRRTHDEMARVFADATNLAGGARLRVESAQRNVADAKEKRLEYDRLAGRISDLESEQRLNDELNRAFSDLRTDLNFELRPDLSDIASEFLKHLTDGRYTELELDDKYKLLVLEQGVPKPVISGGEEDLANLVLRLAISQMIAERAGRVFSLLVLDEVFGSLDDVRRQNVISLLRALQDRFEQVIVITHIEGVRDGLDRVISVGFDERTGAAVVTQPDSGLPELPVGLLAGGAA